MNKHTPGPWTATRDTDVRGNPCWRIDAPTVSLIAAMSYSNAGARAEGIHDARLIAAAPDLLAALTDLVESLALDTLQDGGQSIEGAYGEQFAAARRAIAKVKGAI